MTDDARVGLSPAQRRVYDAQGRTILAVGAVGSGKSHVAALTFVDRAMAGPPGHHLVMGRSPLQLRHEILPLIQERLDTAGVPWRWNGSERVLSADGHKFFLLAWTNAISEGRFRGMNARLGLMEEAALVDEPFFEWAQTRLRLPGAQLICTSNPEGPRHWLKRRIDDGRIDAAITLLMADNPGLGAAEAAEIERQFVPGSAAYRRAIEGVWAAATGLIFPRWTVSDEIPDGQGTGAICGVDFGSTNPTAVVRVECRVRPVSWWVTDVLMVESSADAHVPPSEQARRIAAWIEQHPAERAVVDPSASPLIAELRRAAPRLQVAPANNDVSHGIAEVGKAFASGQLRLRGRERTGPLQDELASYTWDPRRDDTPRKEDDHAVDALRYAVAALARPPLMEVW